MGLDFDPESDIPPCWRDRGALDSEAGAVGCQLTPLDECMRCWMPCRWCSQVWAFFSNT